MSNRVLIEDPRPASDSPNCPTCGFEMVYHGESYSPSGDCYHCSICHKNWLEVSKENEKEAISRLSKWGTPEW